MSVTAVRTRKGLPNSVSFSKHLALDSGVNSRVYILVFRKRAVEQLEFRIGEVATRASVSVDTVRYYERLKLLPRARRTSGGFRVFGLESIERVQFIKQAQELGLTLDEIRGLLATGGAEECQRVHDLLNEKLHELDERLRSLRSFRRVLVRHLTECDRELREHGQNACCPVLAIGKHPAPQGKAATKADHTSRKQL